MSIKDVVDLMFAARERIDYNGLVGQWIGRAMDWQGNHLLVAWRNNSFREERCRIITKGRRAG